MSEIDSASKRWADAQHNIGKILGDDVRRDALHFAVAPINSSNLTLSPGQHIGIGGDGEASLQPPYLGIVDPFLTAKVKPGERFWLVLYPNTITSLRHVWDHPAFAEEDSPKEPDGKAKSEKWMQNWAIVHMSEDYYGDGGRRLGAKSAFDFAIEAGHSHHIGPYESARDHIDATWWNHWETITGQRGDRDEYFSCAC